MNQKLDQVSTADLSGCSSVAAMAGREQWEPDRYAIALAENIRNSGMSLDLQRERLAVLAGAGAAAGQASADELARHFSILEALWHRFARAAAEALDSGLPRASETAERYLSASLKAQRAAASCLSSLLVLRQQSAPTTLPFAATSSTVAAPVTVETLAAK